MLSEGPSGPETGWCGFWSGLGRDEVARERRQVADAVFLGGGGGGLERAPRLLGIGIAEEAAAEVLAARGVERAPERLPGSRASSQRGARLPRASAAAAPRASRLAALPTG